MLVCPQCGQEELGQSTQCRRCGADLPVKTLLDMPALGGPAAALCTSCGARLPLLGGRCLVCGQATEQSPDELPTEVAKHDVRREQALQRPADPDAKTATEDFGADVVPTKETRLRTGRRSTTAQIKAVFADSASREVEEAQASDAEQHGGATDLLQQHLSEQELQETVGRARTPSPSPRPPGASARPRTESDPFALPSLSEVHELPPHLRPTAAVEPDDLSDFAAPGPSSGAEEVAAPAPAARDELPQEEEPTEVEEPTAEDVPHRRSPSGAGITGLLEPTLPPTPRPTREQAARVEEALSRATAAERLDEAQRAVEASVDRSRPQLRAIHAGGLPAHSSASQGVRAVLEPPLAPGRRHQDHVSYDDPTTVYPALAERVPASLDPLDTSLRTEQVSSISDPDRAPQAAAVAADRSPQQECCPACGTEVESGIKFCGQCGAEVWRPSTRLMPARSSGPLPQLPKEGAAGRARLLLVRGSSRTGSSWTLHENVNSAGRLVGTLLFSTDAYSSPLHATFYYRGDRLYVRDERSRNGVFIRLRRPEELRDGDRLSLGRQLLLLDASGAWQQRVLETRSGDDTLLLASPAGSESIVLVRLFCSGEIEVFRRHQRVVSMGRSGCDINFPDDDFLSQRHARVLQSGNYTVVEDLGSRNGTFLAVRREQLLEHGDEVMIGSQVLRVEMT